LTKARPLGIPWDCKQEGRQGGEGVTTQGVGYRGTGFREGAARKVIHNDRGWTNRGNRDRQKRKKGGGSKLYGQRVGQKGKEKHFSLTRWVGGVSTERNSRKRKSRKREGRGKGLAQWGCLRGGSMNQDAEGTKKTVRGDLLARSKRGGRSRTKGKNRGGVLISITCPSVANWKGGGAL